MMRFEDIGKVQCHEPAVVRGRTATRSPVVDTTTPRAVSHKPQEEPLHARWWVTSGMCIQFRQALWPGTSWGCSQASLTQPACSGPSFEDEVEWVNGVAGHPRSLALRRATVFRGQARRSGERYTGWERCQRNLSRRKPEVFLLGSDEDQECNLTRGVVGV